MLLSSSSDVQSPRSLALYTDSGRPLLPVSMPFHKWAALKKRIEPDRPHSFIPWFLEAHTLSL